MILVKVENSSCSERETVLVISRGKITFQVKILKINEVRIFWELGRNMVEELDHRIFPG